MTSLLPAEMLRRMNRRARRGNLMLLRSLCEFRDWLSDMQENEIKKMQCYKEAARAMMLAAATVRDYMGKIGDYPEERLLAWLSNGLSFDHLEKANQYADAKKMQPAELLDFALTGNEYGFPMTVDEMVCFSLGEKENMPRREMRAFMVLFEKLRKFPLKFEWDNEKSKRFSGWLILGLEFFEESK